jgi:hypothetical protein
MADYHEYVDGIRAILQSGQLPDEATLRDLAGGYARTCAEANERLMACVRLLHQGLRAEAIHQAETEPNLLGTLTSLDFPQRAEWDELTDDKGLVRSQALNLDAARELNEAYAEHDPLRDLLRRHRRMALAHASLPKRLALLRTIASQDPNTPVWRDDIQNYERARLLQVQEEANRALTRMDTEGLQSLLTELEDTRWTTPPPAPLVRRVHEELTQVRRVQGRRVLGSIAEELRKAYHANDLATARSLRDRWDDQAPLAGVVDHDPLLEQVRPALVWVEEESQRQAADQAYERAVADLRAALERGETDPQTLTELGEALDASGRGTPQDLAAQLTPRLIELRKRRFRRNLTGGSIAAAVLLAALLSLYQLLSARTLASRSLQTADYVNGLLDNGELDGAQNWVKTLPPGIKTSPAMKEPLRRMETAREHSKQEEGRLAKWISMVKNLVADLPDPPPLKDEAGTITIPRDLRPEYDGTVRSHRRRYEQRREQSEREFLGEVDEILKSLAALETLARDSIHLPDLDRKAAQVQLALEPLLRTSDVKVKGVIPRAQALMDRLALVQKRRSEWLRQEDLQQKLTASSVMTSFNDASFTRVLQDFTKEFPEDEKGKDYKRVLDESPIWRGALAWAKLLEKWKRGHLLKLDAEAASARAEECRRILNDYPLFPDRDLADQYQKYLEAVARREGKGARASGKPGGVRAELEDVWGDPFATELYLVTRKADNKRYYFKEPADPKPTGLQCKCIVDVDPNSPKHLRVLLFPDATIEPPERAPQWDIALKVSNPQFLEKGWEAASLEILRDLCDRKKKFNAVYRFYLLKATAELAAEGSLALEKALQPLLKALGRVDINTKVKWMNPDDEPANRERRNAESALEQLPSLAAVDEQVRTFHRELTAKLTRVRIPVGRLVRDRTTAWRFGEGRPVSPGTKLWIASPVEGGPSVWQDVGTTRAQNTHLNGGSAGARAWIEGRPVFADLDGSSRTSK